MTNRHTGSTFDSFLDEEGIRAEVDTIAKKRLKKPKIPPKPWTPERTARFKTLITLGYSAKQIAEDPIVHTTVHNVRRHSHRLGIKMRTARSLITPRAADLLMHAAMVRHIDVQDLIMRVFDILVDNLTLLDNILDDGFITLRER